MIKFEDIQDDFDSAGWRECSDLKQTEGNKFSLLGIMPSNAEFLLYMYKVYLGREWGKQLHARYCHKHSLPLDSLLKYKFIGLEHEKVEDQFQSDPKEPYVNTFTLTLLVEED